MKTPARLDVLSDRYRGFPWLALLRALELETFEGFRDQCVSPVLDLGCGDGLIAGMAFDSPLEAGIDVDEHVVRAATSSGVYRSVLVGSARELPFPAGTFRSVYSNGALEHMDDLGRVLDEVQRVLVPGGVFVFLVPSSRFVTPVGRLPRLFGGRLWRAFNDLHNHVNLHSATQWTAMLRKHGLDVNQVVEYGSRAVAGYVSTRDLMSKVRVGLRRPFLSLRHDGNLGRMTFAGSFHRARRLARRESDVTEGYWLAISSRKSSEARGE